MTRIHKINKHGLGIPDKLALHIQVINSNNHDNGIIIIIALSGMHDQLLAQRDNQ